MRTCKPLIRLGQGSYQHDVAPNQLKKPLDLLFVLAFAVGVAVGWLLTR